MKASIRLFEWSSRDYTQLGLHSNPKEFVPGLQKYLDEVWLSRNWFIDEDSKKSKSLKQQFFTFSFDQIKARNYVGVIQYGSSRIEVYPKIFKGQQTTDYKSYFQHLFYWLSYCRKINFPVSKAALSEIDTEDFLEALIYIFANYTEKVLAEQPYQAFQEVKEETPFLRGRLAFPEYINQNLVTGRWQYFQSEYEPLVYDNLFNRIVKYTAKTLAQVSRNSRNTKKLQDILFILDEVSDYVCVASDCDKVKLNPLYSDLEDVLQLCRLFLSNLTVNTGSPADSNFCFMLPMDYVFEDFIFSFIKEHFPHLGAEDQKETYLARSNNKDVFKIKNDILIKSKKLIIDTKYKIRYDAQDGKRGVSQSDMYQMLAYAVKRGYQDVLLLYPATPKSNASDSEFEVSSPLFPLSTVNIKAKNIDICAPQLEDLDTNIYIQLNTLLNNT